MVSFNEFTIHKCSIPIEDVIVGFMIEHFVFPLISCSFFNFLFDYKGHVGKSKTQVLS